MSAYRSEYPRAIALLMALSILANAQQTLAALVDGETVTSLSPYFFVEGGDSGVDQLPLKSTSAKASINGFIASVQLSQVYRNEGNQPINATYIFPGSTRAAVNAMTMTIGERVIVAKVREKKEAKMIFEAAKNSGKSASLLSQKRPNVFSMAVANIMPGDEVTVALSYTEILTAEDGIYEFVYPGVVGPRYGGDAESSAAEVQWIPYDDSRGGPRSARRVVDRDHHTASPGHGRQAQYEDPPARCSQCFSL